MLLLGSNSPRRKELIAGLGLAFRVIKMDDVDESFPASLPVEEIPLYISQIKAEAYLPMLDEGETLITADTIVEIGGEILGKPGDEAEALGMLRKLSGKTHRVVTGVTLSDRKHRYSFSESTWVTFVELSDEEIEKYVREFQPLDKAGAYGIQEWIGYVAISRIEGSFYNVMGLPVCRLNRELKRF